MSLGEHRFDEDAHGAARGVRAPDDTEAERAVPRALLEHHRPDLEGDFPLLAGQRAEAGLAVRLQGENTWLRQGPHTSALDSTCHLYPTQPLKSITNKRASTH